MQRNVVYSAAQLSKHRGPDNQLHRDNFGLCQEHKHAKKQRENKQNITLKHVTHIVEVVCCWYLIELFGFIW